MKTIKEKNMISAEKVPPGEVERVRRESLEDFRRFLESIKRLSHHSEQMESLEQYQREFIRDWTKMFEAMVSIYETARSPEVLSFASLMLCVLQGGSDKMSAVESMLSCFVHCS